MHLANMTADHPYDQSEKVIFITEEEMQAAEQILRSHL